MQDITLDEAILSDDFDFVLDCPPAPTPPQIRFEMDCDDFEWDDSCRK